MTFYPFFLFTQPLPGLALVYVLQTVALTQFAVKKYRMSRRVMTYTNLDSEPGYKVERLPQEHWPREGNIIFQNVSLTCYPGGPQALKKINLSFMEEQISGKNVMLAHI